MKIAVALLAVAAAAPACSGKKPQDARSSANTAAEQHTNDLLVESGHALTTSVASLDQARTPFKEAFAKLEAAVPADKAAVKQTADAAWADVVHRCDALDKAADALGPTASAEQVKAAAKPVVDAIHDLDRTRVALYRALNELQDAVQDRPENAEVVGPYEDFSTAWNEVANRSGELAVLTGAISTTDLDARVAKLRADDKMLSSQEDSSSPAKLLEIASSREQIHMQLAELTGALFVTTRLHAATLSKECLENPLAKGCQ